MKFQFKEETPFEERSDEAEKIRKTYPDLVPVIVEQDPLSHLNDLDKKKFLVPSHLTLGQFNFYIRRRINMGSHQPLYLYVKNKIPSLEATMESLYRKHQEKDYFLYISYSDNRAYDNDLFLRHFRAF